VKCNHAKLQTITLSENEFTANDSDAKLGAINIVLLMENLAKENMRLSPFFEVWQRAHPASVIAQNNLLDSLQNIPPDTLNLILEPSFKVLNSKDGYFYNRYLAADSALISEGGTYEVLSAGKYVEHFGAPYAHYNGKKNVRTYQFLGQNYMLLTSEPDVHPKKVEFWVRVALGNLLSLWGKERLSASISTKIGNVYLAPERLPQFPGGIRS
jgi:hypothetical protein